MAKSTHEREVLRIQSLQAAVEAAVQHVIFNQRVILNQNHAY